LEEYDYYFVPSAASEKREKMEEMLKEKRKNCSLSIRFCQRVLSHEMV
jgi:hypothetical protein